ncbi:unnamed protein product [Toxocara canis]|uniref:GLOBIN domain-containing protein n=1 Tax=Toxocara canis TaxID=6265 RepID=A0A183ULY2_TOXCA|nr:unnamed protein product [Toxocara canis]
MLWLCTNLIDTNPKHDHSQRYVRAPKLDKAAVQLMIKSWPEHFGCLFDMGLCAFERLFEKRPDLMEHFSFTDKSNWKKDDNMKKVVLALEQMLVHAVSVFGEEKGPQEANEAVSGFSDLVKELGGLHRHIAPALTLADFDFFFEMLPQARSASFFSI